MIFLTWFRASLAFHQIRPQVLLVSRKIFSKTTFVLWYASGVVKKTRGPNCMQVNTASNSSILVPIHGFSPSSYTMWIKGIVNPRCTLGSPARVFFDKRRIFYFSSTLQHRQYANLKICTARTYLYNGWWNMASKPISLRAASGGVCFPSQLPKTMTIRSFYDTVVLEISLTSNSSNSFDLISEI